MNPALLSAATAWLDLTADCLPAMNEAVLCYGAHRKTFFVARRVPAEGGWQWQWGTKSFLARDEVDQWAVIIHRERAAFKAGPDTPNAS